MFNVKKIIDSVRFILKLSDSKMNYTKLIKLLYIADKKSLELSGQTITDDYYVNMHNGPVLSELYDCIKFTKGENIHPKDINNAQMFSKYFIVKDYDIFDNISGKVDVPINELSPFEENLLKDIVTKFKDFSFTDMIKYVHNADLFPEYHDPGCTSSSVNLKEMLKSVGMSDEEITNYLEEKMTYVKEDNFFNTL